MGANRPDPWATAKARDDAEKAERERERVEIERARAEATPVRVVAVQVPFETVSVIGGFTLVALLFFGVL
jgi:hypothetical protein